MTVKRSVVLVLVLVMVLPVVVPRVATAGGGGCGGDSGCENAMIGVAIGTAVVLVAGLLFLWWKNRQRSAPTAARPHDKPAVRATGTNDRVVVDGIGHRRIVAESP
jgi:hypothetical protein